MYPYLLFGFLSLYEVFLAAGVISALIVLRILSDKLGFEAKYFNFCLLTGVIAIIGGYGSAVLFQAFYNYAATGIFIINAKTGATFYGGLVGGAVLFLSIYFAAGHFVFRDRLHIINFYPLAGIAACSITAAHSIGRLGCLMAGCCHGVASERCGIFMSYPGYRVVPVQLYEAIFLAALFVWFLVRVLRGKGYNLPLYLICYGVWRFFIEYVRGDYRGSTFVSFLSPSQLTALILIAAGAVLFLTEKRHLSRESTDQPEGGE